MANLRVNGQNIPFEQLRQLNPGVSREQAQVRTDTNGLDEVYLRIDGHTYLAVGESLQTEALRGSSQVMVQLAGDKKEVAAQVLGHNDEINSFAEGWSKGTSFSDSMAKAWSGLNSARDWSAIHQLSSHVSSWPVVSEKTVLPAPAPIRTSAPSTPAVGAVPTPVPGPTRPTTPAHQPKIEVFFSQVHSGRLEDAQNAADNPDVQLAKLLDSAQNKLDIAAFEIDSQRVADAILRAHERGVKVRVVTDSDYMHEPQLQRLLKAGVPIVDDQRSGLMHNKFVVVDDHTVWTGSYNFTDNCAWKNNNNALRIASPELAANYTTEFEEMFVDRKFGRTSPDNTPYPSVTVGKTRIENYFASEGKVAGKVVEALNKAEKSIEFMAFSFTHDAIGEAVAAKIGQGVQVRGVFEKVGSGTQYSEYNALKRLAGADAIRIDGNKHVMHHKVFIIDGKTVVTGSFNFSDSADEKNDENLIVIHDEAIAQQYRAEFARVHAQGQ